MNIRHIFSQISLFKTIIVAPVNLVRQGEINGAINLSKQSNSFIFLEEGVWKGEKNITTTNQYKWTFFEHCITLHCCKGKNHKHLSEFVLNQYCINKLISGTDYICNKDLYKPKVKFFNSSILLSWKITGPKKDYSIFTYYY
ncbi:MAG: hypothetical protein HRT87_02125 [Legionellales bacterium]|nr:hypothetical protein [Legionellales bacterium]